MYGDAVRIPGGGAGDHVMTIILTSLAAAAMITCVALVMPALARPTLPFGVRVPHERIADPVVLAQRRAYARTTILAGVAAAALSVALVIGAGRASLAGMTTAGLGVACLLLYYRAHRQLRHAKHAGGWHEGRRQGVTVDTTFRTDPVRLPWVWLIPAMTITLTTTGLGWWRYGALPATLPHFLGLDVDATQPEPTTPIAAFQPAIFQAATILVFLAMTLVLLRARPDLDAARPKGSARKYRIYLHGVARMSLLGAASVTFCLMIAALQLWGLAALSSAWRAAAYLPLAAPVVGALVWEMRVGHGGHRLPALPGEEREDSGITQRDDDRHWFFAGTVYANRRDPAIVLHARFGQTLTLNLGHPVTWAILALLAVVVLLATFGAIDLPQRDSLS